MYYYTFRDFTGIEQHKSGEMLGSGTASMAKGIATQNGQLQPFKDFSFVYAIEGKESWYTSWFDVVQNPDFPSIFYIFALIGQSDVLQLYVYNSSYSTWTNTVLSVPSLAVYSSMLARIGTTDYLLWATTAGIKRVKIPDGTIEDLGSGVSAYDSTVSSYNSETLTITVADTLSTEAARRALVAGVYYGASDSWAAVASASGTSIVLSSAPTTAPAASDVIEITGGIVPSAKFITEYAGRMFAAYDNGCPNRLYWSCVAGDGRTWADWDAVEGSADASGGYTDIGHITDNITGIFPMPNELLIFKMHSLWRLYGDRPSNFTIERICTVNNHAYHNQIVECGGLACWFTRYGIHCYNGSSVSVLGEGYRKLAKIASDLNLYNDCVRAFAINDVLYFPVSCSSAKCLLAYDMLRDSYMFYSADRFRNYYEYRGVLFASLYSSEANLAQLNRDLANTSVPGAYWTTQLTDFGESYTKKQVKWIAFRAEGTKLILKLTCDKQVIEKLITIPADGFVRISFNAKPCVAMQLTISTVPSCEYWKIIGGITVAFDKEVIA